MRSSLAAVVLALAAAQVALAVSETTVMFQNGVDGYNGTFDMRISMRTTRDGTLGGNVATYLIDGYRPDNPETPNTDEFSPDENNLIRFDDIFGNGPGQIPLGATILDAQLTMSTAGGGTANSPGPWGVARLLQAFDENTSYADFPGGGPVGFRGAWYEDGYATRSVGGFDGQTQNAVDSADVRAIVQSWSDGEPNHGMAMQAGWPGQTNGWGFFTTGNGGLSNRPKLSVTYTTDPIEINTFQRDLNGYAGDTMARLDSGAIQTTSGANPDATVDDITYDGYTGQFTVSPTSTVESPANLTNFEIFLDGPTFSTEVGVLNSFDQIALVKFDNVFGEGAGQSPADKEVAKAWLVLTTGDDSNNARSNGNWDASIVTHDWDTTTLYSELGPTPGLQQGEDITAPISTTQGMITGSEVWFDVTEYAEGIRTGADNYGVAISTTFNGDGWQIHLNGSPEAALRPRLIVVSDLSEASVGGDFNGDGVVDAADYVVWRRSDGTPSGYNEWRENFGAGLGAGGGGSLSSGAVPEPGSLALLLVACVGVGFASRKRKAH